MKAIVSSVMVLTALCGIAENAIAQVVSDNTLGTQVTQSGAVFGINNGVRSGTNLFHSFSQFSVPTGGSAIFNNALDIQNIFSRVTGSQASNINGILKSQGSANLFLMNPNGMVFGPNAQLQLGGSFLGTTASGMKFADAIEFNTLNATPALLSINLPIGLQMGTNPGAIAVNGKGHTLQLPSTFSPVIRTSPQVGLQVKPNQTLALVGGNVNLNGGVLSAPQGRLEILSGANGTIGLTRVPQGWHLNADSLQSYRDISLTHRSSLEASGAGNTNIQLVGKTIQILKGSIALMVTQGFQPPGSVQIKASEAFQLSGVDPSGQFGSFVINDVFAGTGAEMTIVAPKIMLSDTAMIHSRSFGKSQAGNVAINASTLQIDGQADRNPSIRTRIAASTLGQSNAGILTISTDQLDLVNGGIISSSNLGSGRGGDIVIVANTVKVDGFSPRSQLSSLLTSAALGAANAGNLSIQTQVLSVTRGGNINTSTLAGGNASSLEINATRSIEVSGGIPLLSGGIEASTIASAASVVPRDLQQRLGLPPIPSGSAGSLTINTPSLSILDGATVKVDNEGLGNAGNLRVNANFITLKGGSTIKAATAVGEGGNLSLQSQMLVLRDRSSITATAGGAGQGGNITIQSPIVVGLGNSDIVANALKGKGGNIRISTQSILGLKYRTALTSDNDITASSQFGINGNVQVNTIGVNPANSLNALPTDITDSSTQIANQCGASKNSSFIATGRGGIPKNPSQKRGSDRSWNDLRPLTATSSSVTVSTVNPIQPLIEASALQIDASGTLALVAAQPIPIQTSATCSIDKP